jgi:hypothetical protein
MVSGVVLCGLPPTPALPLKGGGGSGPLILNQLYVTQTFYELWGAATEWGLSLFSPPPLRGRVRVGGNSFSARHTEGRHG